MLLGFCPARFGAHFCLWCSDADTHLKLQDRVVNGARFLTGGVFGSDIDHRRSVTALCMPYKIRCNPMHPLNYALPGPYVPASTGCTRFSGRRSPYLCAASLQNLAVSHDFYSPIYVPVERYWWRVSMVLDWRVSRAGPMLFYGLSCSIPTKAFYYFPPFFLSIGWYCGAGVFELIGCISLSVSLALPTYFNNNNNNDKQYWEFHLRSYLLTLIWFILARVIIFLSLVSVSMPSLAK